MQAFGLPTLPLVEDANGVIRVVGTRIQQADALRSTIESGTGEMVGFRGRLLARQRPPV
jgi:hypothetical protein